MVKKSQFSYFLTYLSIPFCFFVLALFFADSGWFLQPSAIRAKDAAYMLSNEKLNRSVQAFLLADKSQKKTDKKKAVDRVGISFDFTMLDEIKEKFDLPLTFVGTESARMSRHEVLLSINNQNEYKALVHVHGHSSARKKRKSYCVNLIAPQLFKNEVYLEKFLLLNLLEDPYGFEFKFAYDLLSELNLFHSYNQFAVVTINGESQGLYLVVERPKDAILRTQQNVVSILRKRVGEDLYPLYVSPDNNPLNLVNRINNALFLEDKKKQAELLFSIVDMNSYMNWLIINSLLENSDTRDELFLYEVKSGEENRMHYMAWDYGDLQEKELLSDKDFSEKLFWAPHQKLDRIIVENPYLYSKYKNTLKNVLTSNFTEKKLHKLLNDIKTKLSTINIEIIDDKTKSLHYKRSIFMKNFENKLFSRRRYLLNSL